MIVIGRHEDTALSSADDKGNMPHRVGFCLVHRLECDDCRIIAGKSHLAFSEKVSVSESVRIIADIMLSPRQRKMSSAYLVLERSSTW